jgi:glycine cleavage system H protein
MEKFELLYAETHEWLGVIEGSDMAYIGISTFALKELTDIVYIELPVRKVSSIKKGDSFGLIESVKAVSDLYAPVDGDVIEINQIAVDDPATLVDNDDPWLIKIRINDPDTSHLMSQGEYEEQIKNDG